MFEQTTISLIIIPVEKLWPQMPGLDNGIFHREFAMLPYSADNDSSPLVQVRANGSKTPRFV